MSNLGKEFRSFLSIDKADLRRLAEIARKDREEYFELYPEWKRLYADRLLGVALCQGAALHYIDGITGINDFDIYTFYRTNPTKDWYPKRIKRYDFGDPKFGKSKNESQFVGRRVDCMGRGIEVQPVENIVSALRRYLELKRPRTPVELKKKAIVLLEPHCGKVVWPVKFGEHK